MPSNEDMREARESLRLTQHAIRNLQDQFATSPYTHRFIYGKYWTAGGIEMCSVCGFDVGRKYHSE